MSSSSSRPVVRAQPGYHASVEIHHQIARGVGAAVEVDLCAVCRKVVTDDVFSICCDKCDRWVHGHCIEMDAAVGEQVKKYYCPECQDEHDLEVVYKKKKKGKKRKASGSPSPNPQRSASAHDASAEGGGIDDFVSPMKSPPPKQKVVYPPRECAHERCTTIHRRKSKYCSNDCGMAQARLNFERGKCTEAVHVPSSSTTSPSSSAEGVASEAGGVLGVGGGLEQVKWVTRADREDLREFEEVRRKFVVVAGQITQLEAKRMRHEEVIRANMRLSTEQIQAAGGSGDQPAAAAAPKEKDAFLFDCQCCGKQIPASSFIRHSEQCFMRVTKGLYGVDVQVAPLKKAKHQICGYPLRKAAAAAAAAVAAEGGGAAPSALTCMGLCTLPWRSCQKHYNWETHKREEFAKAGYALDRQVERLREAEAMIRRRMQRRLEQCMSGDSRSSRSVAHT
jgi:hypothetical protein